MAEYFIVANSFAAPFVSDKWEVFVSGESPEEALTTFAAGCGHPAGLYAAEIYADANSYHKSDKPLARWLSNHEAALREATKDRAAYSYMGHGPGQFEVDGKPYHVDDPKGGSLQAA